MSGEPMSRAILNANRGISNVIEQKIINTDLRRVTDDLFKILMHHYGPYSGFAALDDSQPLNETNFTKDGIGIVRAIEYASPQEEWVRKTIAYIGSKMESSVGDGTTSAMMFTCAMLKHMSEHINELKPLSYNKFREEFNDFVTWVKKGLYDKFVYSAIRKHEDKDEEYVDEAAIRRIVHDQVYTSAHGDEELAYALAELYVKTPRELWERMTYERRRYESDERFEIISSEGQYQMQINVLKPSMLNKDLASRYEGENCTVIVVNDSLRVGSPDWPAICKLIKESTVVRPVVIISHNLCDEETYNEISTLDEQCSRSGNPFAVFTAKPDHPQINDFAAIQLLSDIDVYKLEHGQATILEGCHVKYQHKKLSIDGIYEVPEGYTGLERHMVTDGKHGVFTDHLEAWKKQAELYTNNAIDRENRQWANYYNRMYVKLRYEKTHSVVIGGKSYDNVAFVDVVDDAIKAASRALTHGVTLGNNRALYLVVNQIIGNPHVSNTVDWFARRVKESLIDISKVVLKRIHPGQKLPLLFHRDFTDWWFSHVVDLLQYDHSILSCKPWRHQRAPMPVVNNRIRIGDLFSTNHVVCQPANSDLTMLERFGEIALKFILTERIIIHGGAYVDKKRK